MVTWRIKSILTTALLLSIATSPKDTLAGSVQGPSPLAERPIPTWLARIPTDSPIPLMIGVGGGIRTGPVAGAQLESAARANGAEAFNRWTGVDVRKARARIHVGLHTRQQDRVEVAPWTDKVTGDDVACLDRHYDSVRNLLYCLAVPVEQVADPRLLRRLEQWQISTTWPQARPSWLESPPSEPGWIYAVGYANRVVPSSAQLRRAENRALGAIASQVEERIAVDQRRTQTGPWQRAQRTSIGASAVSLRAVELRAIWQTREKSAVWVLMRARVAPGSR